MRIKTLPIGEWRWLYGMIPQLTIELSKLLLPHENVMLR